MKKTVKLNEKDLSNLIQRKVNELYDDPKLMYKFENEINEHLGACTDALIEGYSHLNEAGRMIEMSGNMKKYQNLFKLRTELYNVIDSINDAITNLNIGNEKKNN